MMCRSAVIFLIFVCVTDTSYAEQPQSKQFIWRPVHDLVDRLRPSNDATDIEQCDNTFNRELDLRLDSTTAHYGSIEFSGFLYPHNAEFYFKNNVLELKFNHIEDIVITHGGLKNKYNLDKILFAADPNHTISSERFRASVQFVFYNSHHQSIYDAAAYKDGIAILGVFLKGGGSPNPAMNIVIENLKALIQNPQARLVDNILSPGSFLPQNTCSFFRYRTKFGSNDCMERVVWTTFTDTLQVSTEQLNELVNLLKTTTTPNSSPIRISLLNQATGPVEKSSSTEKLGTQSSTTPRLTRISTTVKPSLAPIFQLPASSQYSNLINRFSSTRTPFTPTSFTRKPVQVYSTVSSNSLFSPSPLIRSSSVTSSPIDSLSSSKNPLNYFPIFQVLPSSTTVTANQLYSTSSHHRTSQVTPASLINRISVNPSPIFEPTSHYSTPLNIFSEPTRKPIEHQQPIYPLLLSNSSFSNIHPLFQIIKQPTVSPASIRITTQHVRTTSKLHKKPAFSTTPTYSPIFLRKDNTKVLKQEKIDAENSERPVTRTKRHIVTIQTTEMCKRTIVRIPILSNLFQNRF